MVTKKSLMYTGVCIMCLCFVWFTKQLGVYLQTLDKHCIMTFTKIPPVENELFHADGHYESGSRFSQRFKTSWKGNTDFMFISSTCIAVSGIIEKKIHWRWPWIRSLKCPDLSLLFFSASHTWSHFLPTSSSTCELLLLSEIITQPFHVGSLLPSAYLNPLHQITVSHNAVGVSLCTWYIYFILQLSEENLPLVIFLF